VFGYMFDHFNAKQFRSALRYAELLRDMAAVCDLESEEVRLPAGIDRSAMHACACSVSSG